MSSSDRYYYRVKACNSSGCSNHSNSDDASYTIPVPDRVENLTASYWYGSQLTRIHWDSVEGADYYEVRRSCVSEGVNGCYSDTFGEDKTIATNSYTDKISQNAAAAIEKYRVQACNASGCSGWRSTELGG